MTTAARPQSRENKIEEGIVLTIADELIGTVTDRSGGDHAHPWDPSRQVRVGVLRGQRDDHHDEADTDGGSDSDSTAEDTNEAAATPAPGVALDNTGIIGLDFVVAPTAGASEAEIRCDVAFALYQPLRPDPASLVAEAASAVATAAQKDGANNDPKKRKKRPQVRFNSGWRRYDLEAALTITVPLDADTAGIKSSHLAGDPLTSAVVAAVDNHYQLPEAARPLMTNQMLQAAKLNSAADVDVEIAARTDPEWVPEYPAPVITASGFLTVDGHVAIELSIRNEKTYQGNPFQDFAVYDTRLRCEVIAGADLQPQVLGFADEDLRYETFATVPARGRGCAAKLVDGMPNTISAETLPLHSQLVLEPAAVAGADVSYKTLSDLAQAQQSLGAISQAMRTFLRGWDNADVTDPEHKKQLDKLRATFEAETERFELGFDLISRDRYGLGRAVALANESFSRANPGGGWRLFQLIFIITELGGLAAREDPANPVLAKELETVDVLWFPTGGGKTEAYLGLVAVALFFDRIRGKHRGHSAWLLFPLRMLSVQQLARVSLVLHHAEAVRNH